MDDDDDYDDDDNVDPIDVAGFDAGGSRHDLEEDDDREDDWDEEFEESLRGLSEEELIDELIEDSPSLTQLEMEILSQEMERSEREEVEGEGDGGLDYDSLDDFDLSGSAAYRDFRAMVLEDYRERGKTRRARATDSPPSATTTTNFAGQTISSGRRLGRAER